MKTIMAISLFWLATLASAEEVIQEISWSKLKQAGSLSSGQVIAAGAQTEFGQLRLENTESTPASIPLFLLERPGISRYIYALKGKIRYENVEGEGYLEMWNVFPGDQKFFSRTIAKVGPMQVLHGSSAWRSVVVPFFNQEGGTPPVRLELNLFLAGKGTVYLSDLRLLQYDPGENPLIETGAMWWDERTSGLVFGSLGACLGVLGALIGVLCSLGKARAPVMILLNAFLVIGLVCFALGIVAFAKDQPYPVFYPLLLTGFLCTLLSLSLRRSIRKRYEDLEFRKMQSMDTLGSR